MDRNEALEIVRKKCLCEGKETLEALRILIPELKESEDERIKKGLIEHLKELKEQSVEGSHLKRPEHYDAWIAWLEKQGEQNLAEWSKEDEDMLACCEIAINFFKNLGKNSSGHPRPNYFDLDEKVYPESVIDWLKSLKERFNVNNEKGK